MSCSQTPTCGNAAVITPVLAAGSTTSPYYISVHIAQRLCQRSCAATPPVFRPAFTVVGWREAASGQYLATLLVQGVIAYTPCGQGPCCTQSQLVSQAFTIPVASATAPTSITVTAGEAANRIDATPCRTCSRNFVSDIPLTLTVA